MAMTHVREGGAPRLGTHALLLLLALANFAIGFGAFVVVAILTPLADGLGIGEATAGWTMTAYAIAYAIGSPLGIALTGRLDRRTVLAAGMALFAAGTLACALAPTFETLLAARVLSALGGGLVTPLAASVAIGLVKEAERGRALATVFGGLTISQAVGVPLGAWLGYTVGWRETFALVAVLALPISIVLWLRLPKGLVVPVTSLSALGRALSRFDLTLAVSFTVVFMGGVWVVYTFFAPILETRLGLGGAGVSIFLFLFGIGAILGNAMGGRLTDAIGPVRTLAWLCAGQMIVMPLLTLLPLGSGTPSVALAGALVLAWSVVGWSFMVPQQARLAALEPALAPVLLALNASAIYIAASLGSLIGGRVLDGAGLGALGPIGAALVVAALATLPAVTRLSRRQRVAS